jgi:hypothetical protein
LLVAGWSCKDLSRLSKDYAQKNNSNVLEEKRGSSGQTLEEIIDVFSENRLYLISAMRGAGYVTDVVKVASSEYGHWTKRVRAYIVALNLEKCELSDSEAACQ